VTDKILPTYATDGKRQLIGDSHALFMACAVHA